jgi:hypothetical protein
MRFFTTTGLAFALVGSALADPGVSPASVNKDVDPGSSFEVDKVVTTAEIPPTPDVVFLVDVTGSMAGAINNIKTNLDSIISTITAAQPSALFAVTSFGDYTMGPYAFEVNQALTNNVAALHTAVNSLPATGGGDIPEDWINALFVLTTGAITYRAGSSRIIILVSDAPSHDPSGGHTLADAIAALQSQSIRVIGVNVGGLDSIGSPGQATRVTTATGGVIVGTTAGAVASAIVSGLKNLDVVVKPDVVSCDTGLTATFDQPSIKVASGTAATFHETVTVARDAPQGATLHCSVSFLLNDAPGGDAFIQSIAVPVIDITPPVVACTAGPNPDGWLNPDPWLNRDPDANFWTLNAADNVDKDKDLKIFVRDSVSGTVFGPYEPGTTIKLIHTPGAKPEVKPGVGAVNWEITVQGCAVLDVRDAAGNEATANCCCAWPKMF